MALNIRLMGQPSVDADGDAPSRPPRGNKAWALLAYLATSRRSHSRTALAELLFSQADDPLGALRWNLSALRRLLKLPESLRGDAIGLDLPPDASIDVQLLEDGDPAVLTSTGFGEELLAGMSFPDCATFEGWLSAERQRMGRLSGSLLTETTLDGFARGDLDAAVESAARLVAIDPFDEGRMALLIRACAMSGDGRAATRHLDRFRELLRSEMGIEPGPAVIAAAHATPVGPERAASSVDPDAILSRMDVAWQSMLAGSVDYGLDVARGAVSMADASSDAPTRLATKTLLGAMLGMAVRGWDESAAALAEAIHLAEQLDLPDDAAAAHGILAGLHYMRGDYSATAAHTQRGLSLSDDSAARSVNLLYSGCLQTDLGDNALAMETLAEAVERARASGDPVRTVYATVNAGRARLIAGDLPTARQLMEDSVDAAAESILALLPYPMAMLAEIDQVDGDLPAAVDQAKRADALAMTTGMAYQQALARRVIGLSLASMGDTDAALNSLTDALAHARRLVPEGYTYQWVPAAILDSLVQVSAPVDTDASRRWAAVLHDQTSALGLELYDARARRHLGIDDGLCR